MSTVKRNLKHPAYKKGMIFYKKKNYTEAFPLILESANEGYIDGQFRIALMYSLGNCPSGKPNYLKAADWYSKAGSNGHARAANNLGVLFYQNKLKSLLQGKKPSQMACRWYQKAAHLGLSEAQYNIGLMFVSGNGIEKSVEKGFSFIEKAALAEFPSAMQYLAMMYFQGKGIDKNPKKGFEWAKKAASAGKIDALYMLSNSYFNGEGVEPNFEIGISYLEKATQAGHLKAQGIATPKFLQAYLKDKKKYEKLLDDAAKYGAKFSATKYLTAHAVGDMILLDIVKTDTMISPEYKTQYRVPSATPPHLCPEKWIVNETYGRKLLEASSYYNLAAKKGHAISQFLLGYCCYTLGNLPLNIRLFCEVDNKLFDTELPNSRDKPLTDFHPADAQLSPLHWDSYIDIMHASVKWRQSMLLRALSPLVSCSKSSNKKLLSIRAASAHLIGLIYSSYSLDLTAYKPDCKDISVDLSKSIISPLDCYNYAIAWFQYSHQLHHPHGLWRSGYAAYLLGHWLTHNASSNIVDVDSQMSKAFEIAADSFKRSISSSSFSFAKTESSADIPEDLLIPPALFDFILKSARQQISQLPDKLLKKLVFPSINDKSLEFDPCLSSPGAGGNFGLGLLFAKGYGVPQSDEKGFQMLTKASDEVHIDALSHLGLLTMQGRGLSEVVLSDVKTATKKKLQDMNLSPSEKVSTQHQLIQEELRTRGVQCLKYAVKHMEPFACFQYGQILLSDNKPIEAGKLFLISFLGNYTNAGVLIASILSDHLVGPLQPVSPSSATLKFTPSDNTLFMEKQIRAQTNMFYHQVCSNPLDPNPVAQTQFAYNIFRGHLPVYSEDWIPTPLTFIVEAANNADPTAQSYLAQLYSLEGSFARFFFNQATSDYYSAKTTSKQSYKHITFQWPQDPTVFQLPNYAKATQWSTKAASQGDVTAHWVLGRLNQMGVLNHIDNKKSALHYFQASSIGSPQSNLQLGLMYKKNSVPEALDAKYGLMDGNIEPTASNIEKAGEWLLEGALENNLDCFGELFQLESENNLIGHWTKECSIEELSAEHYKMTLSLTSTAIIREYLSLEPPSGLIDLESIWNKIQNPALAASTDVSTHSSSASASVSASTTSSTNNSGRNSPTSQKPGKPSKQKPSKLSLSSLNSDIHTLRSYCENEFSNIHSQLQDIQATLKRLQQQLDS